MGVATSWVLLHWQAASYIHGYGHCTLSLYTADWLLQGQLFYQAAIVPKMHVVCVCVL